MTQQNWYRYKILLKQQFAKKSEQLAAILIISRVSVMISAIKNYFLKN